MHEPSERPDRLPVRRLWLALLASVAWGATGCSEAPDTTGTGGTAPRPPNVLLVCLDTTRADSLSAYGHPDDPTPRIAALAAGGVTFEACAAPVPMTLPSHASLMTATYPFVHGVRDNGGFRLVDENETVAEALAQAGYRTAGSVAVFLLNGPDGIAQGFQHWRDTRTAAAGAAVPNELRGDVVAEGALAELRAAAADDRPFFLFVHFFDAHTPYAPPPGYADRFRTAGHDDTQAAYLGELAYVDEQVGRLLDELDALGLADSTVVLLTADHGESMGEHEEVGHSYFVYDATMRVPLIARWPGHLPAGARVAAQVRNIDVAPTILDLCGRPPLARSQGESLVRLMDGSQEDPGHYAYLETLAPWLDYRYSPLRGLRSGRWKYVLAPRSELYDLAADPGEERDVLAEHPDVAAALREKLFEIATSGEPVEGAEAASDGARAAVLAELGYGAGAGGGADEVADLEPRGADPKDRIREMVVASTAQHKIMNGELEEAARLLDGLLRDDPTNVLYLESMGDVALKLSRAELAQAAYQRLVEVDPRHALAHERLARIALALQQPAAALPHLKAWTELRPEAPEGFVEYGRVLALTRDLDGASVALARALELDPSSEAALSFSARLAWVQHRWADVERFLSDGIERLPQSAGLVRSLAWLRATCPDASVRDGAAAVELGSRLETLERPPQPTSCLVRAGALAEVGRFDDALRELGRLRDLARGTPEAVVLGKQADALEKLFRSQQAVRTDEPM